VEFLYNNSHQSTIKMAPFEAVYERKCRNPSCRSDLGEVLTFVVRTNSGDYGDNKEDWRVH